MSIRLVAFLLGQATILIGISMLVPLVYSVVCKTAEVHAFFAAAIIVLCIGEILLRIGKNHPSRMKVLDGACFIFSAVFVLGFCGMLPYFFSGQLSFVDAWFESVSHLTTTGITLFSPKAPYSLRFWGGLVAWLGGLGFIILIMTVLPQVVGDLGIVLSREQELMFSPVLARMKRMAGRAIRVYGALTGGAALLYFIAGLGPLDSVFASMLTVSTDGGSRHLVFLARESVALEMTAILVMLVTSMNFVLLWQTAHDRSFKRLFHDAELRAFLLMIFIFSLAVSFHLLWTGTYDDVAESLRHALFAVTSFGSTSGFMAVPIEEWPDFDRFSLLLLAFVGGCIGSSTGGLKVKRFLILAQMAWTEMKRTLHPHMVADIHVGDQHLSRSAVLRVACYFFLFLATFYVFTMLLALSGVSLPQATGMAVGMLSSVGTALGLYGHETVASLPAWTKIACCLFMILGRLQIFGVFLLISGSSRRSDNHW